MANEQDPIQQTIRWVEGVVIACNFCPFAAKPFKAGQIAYRIQEKALLKDTLGSLANLLREMDEDKSIETLLLIFPTGFTDFAQYLDVVDAAEQLIEMEGYEGVYQLASFHPQYRFSGSRDNDPANYTNRSPFPMLHILREESLEKAIGKYPDTSLIPERNISFSKEKGLQFMKNLLETAISGQKKP